MICIGHRGARGHVPENTLASILKAIELGATCIEIDVRYVDGHLMVFHDYRLERLTDGEGYIADKNVDYLRSLSLSNGEKIPTLEEIYDAVDQRVGINIELKGAGAAESIVNCIKQFRLQGWSDGLILVSSYNHRELARIRELDQNIKIGVLFDRMPVQNTGFQTPGQATQTANVTVPNDAINHWAETWIKDMIRYGIMDVEPDGNFYPDDTINRALYAMAVQRLLVVATRDESIETQYFGEAQSRFSDVPSSHFAYNAMALCTERGIMQVDMMSRKFNPNGDVTGADALLIIRELQTSLRMTF